MHVFAYNYTINFCTEYTFNSSILLFVFSFATEHKSYAI